MKISKNQCWSKINKNYCVHFTHVGLKVGQTRMSYLLRMKWYFDTAKRAIFFTNYLLFFFRLFKLSFDNISNNNNLPWLIELEKKKLLITIKIAITNAPNNTENILLAIRIFILFMILEIQREENQNSQYSSCFYTYRIKISNS